MMSWGSAMARFTLAIVAVLLVSCPVYAQPYDITPLFRSGAWFVEHTYDANNGATWCSAETTNRSNQTFSVTAYASGGATIFVFDPKWSLAERPVKFVIDVDYERWFIKGYADGISVSVNLTGENGAGDFLRDLSTSAAVAIYTDRMDQLGTFSLRGSQEALRTLAKCWERIGGVPALGNSADPF